jgi:4-amino-4-deoxy-L-arabinose transferase-like glycosyltransferase
MPGRKKRSAEGGEATRKRVVVLALACMACLLPFINKAFHIDDPLFIWSAKQIQAHPFDPFGFEVIWGPKPEPMYKESKNPPLACYYMALAGTLLGWSEPALHLVFLLPAVAVIWGTFRLAQHFCSRPALAALVTLAAPVFLISSSSVMCDTMMLAFWVWALVFWEEGLDSKRLGLLCLAGLLIGLGALTKYFAISLVPLLLVYSLVRRGRLGAGVLCLGIPLGIMAAYLTVMYARYGVNLLREAILFSRAFRAFAEYNWQMGPGGKLLMSLTFMGGCLAPVLFLAPALWGWRSIRLLPLPLVVAGLLLKLGTIGPFKLILDGRIQTSLIVQASLFCTCALMLLALAGTDLWRHRDAGSVLLCLWLGGTFFFAGFVNWGINARSILPMAPAAGILIARRIETVAGPAPATKPSWILALPLLLAFVLGVWVTWSDYELAGSARTAAGVLQAYAARHPEERIWIGAYWGFDYYMQEYGFPMINGYKLDCKKGDIIVISPNNLNPAISFPPASWPVAELDIPTSAAGGNWSYASHLVQGREFHTLKVPIHTWSSTMQANLGAGFYLYHHGPLPFAFGKVPDEEYLLLRLAGRPRSKVRIWKE